MIAEGANIQFTKWADQEAEYSDPEESEVRQNIIDVRNLIENLAIGDPAGQHISNRLDSVREILASHRAELEQGGGNNYEIPTADHIASTFFHTEGPQPQGQRRGRGPGQRQRRGRPSGRGQG